MHLISWGPSSPLEKIKGEGIGCFVVVVEPMSVVHSMDDGKLPDGSRRSHKNQLATWKVGSISGKSGDIYDFMLRKKDRCILLAGDKMERKERRDVSSAFYKAMTKKYGNYDISLQLDNCAGQNKCWALYTAMIYLVNQPFGHKKLH